MASSGDGLDAARTCGIMKQVMKRKIIDILKIFIIFFSKLIISMVKILMILFTEGIQDAHYE